MSLILGNQSGHNFIPGANFTEWAHNHNSGNDGCLTLIFASTGSAVATSVTYNGVNMVLKRKESITGFMTVEWSVWELKNPSTGANTVRVNLSAPQWNNISGHCYSFTGCDGIGNTNYALFGSAAQNTISLNVSNNSRVITSLITTSAAIPTLQIPTGTSAPLNYTHDINNKTYGAISTNKLSAGSVQSTVSTANTLLTLEIREKLGIMLSRRIIIV
jgi:hypothetical protein